MADDPKKIPLETRRKLLRDITAPIAKQLDEKGVTEEQIQRDFAAFQKRRRR